jgi:hypothetical protein
MRWGVQHVEKRELPTLPTTHRPPAAWVQQNARPRGTGEVGRRRSIFRRPMVARAPTGLAPAPAFCRSPQLLAHPRPAQCPLSCSAFPRGPGAQKDGAPCVQRQGLVAGHGHASGGAPLHVVEPRLQTCPFKPGSTLRTLESFGTRSDVEPYPWSQPLSPSPTPKPSPQPLSPIRAPDPNQAGAATWGTLLRLTG